MSEEYTPPAVWVHEEQGGTFGSINRPTAGARTEKELPRGEHDLQLYSMATPNGVKVTALLEELHDLYGLEYDAWPISISNADQFSSGFVEINPNSKIPALLHRRRGAPAVRVFESAAIMMYLCETFDADGVLLPKASDPLRPECLSWLFWVQGSAPFLGGGFGHFYNYAPVKIKYAIDRYAMEAKRQFDVLDRHLEKNGPFLCGDRCTIADFCAWPWYGDVVYGEAASEFLQFRQTYKNVVAWSERMGEKKSCQRGAMVNKTWGPKEKQLPERHSASDFTPKL